MTDYYSILGVARSDTLEEIKKAFHRLAHKHHPDKGGDPAKMKELTAAWAWMQQNHRPMAASGIPSDNQVGVDWATTYQPWQGQPFDTRIFEQEMKTMEDYRRAWEKFFGGNMGV